MNEKQKHLMREIRKNLYIGILALVLLGLAVAMPRIHLTPEGHQTLMTIISTF